MRRRLAIALGVPAALVGLAVAAGAPGGLDAVPAQERLTQAVVRSPAWAMPCWLGDAERRDIRVDRCARLRGRVVAVLREDGRRGDVHLVTVAGLRLRHAKIGLGGRRVRVPSVGDRVTVVGPMVRGAHVGDQVLAWHIVDEGPGP